MISMQYSNGNIVESLIENTKSKVRNNILCWLRAQAEAQNAAGLSERASVINEVADAIAAGEAG